MTDSTAPTPLADALLSIPMASWDCAHTADWLRSCHASLPGAVAPLDEDTIGIIEGASLAVIDRGSLEEKTATFLDLGVIQRHHAEATRTAKLFMVSIHNVLSKEKLALPSQPSPPVSKRESVHPRQLMDALLVALKQKSEFFHSTELQDMDWYNRDWYRRDGGDHVSDAKALFIRTLLCSRSNPHGFYVAWVVVERLDSDVFHSCATTSSLREDASAPIQTENKLCVLKAWAETMSGALVEQLESGYKMRLYHM